MGENSSLAGILCLGCSKVERLNIYIGFRAYECAKRRASKTQHSSCFVESGRTSGINEWGETPGETPKEPALIKEMEDEGDNEEDRGWIKGLLF